MKKHRHSHSLLSLSLFPSYLPTTPTDSPAEKSSAQISPSGTTFLRGSYVRLREIRRGEENKNAQKGTDHHGDVDAFVAGDGGIVGEVICAVFLPLKEERERKREREKERRKGIRERKKKGRERRRNE